MKALSVLLALSLAALSEVSAAVTAPPTEVLNFMLLDHQGRACELRRADARVVVLMFTANECPVVRQNISKIRQLQDAYRSQGVLFWLVNSSPGDDRAAIGKEARSLDAWHLPVLKDDTQGVARMLGIRRTAEFVAIETRTWTVIYRGAIDDQMVEGSQKPAPTRRFLQAALDEHLAGKPVSEPRTAARGCVVSYEVESTWPNQREVSYSREVFPILAAKCVGCHSPGNIGSWNMSGHRKVKAMSGTIQETILNHRMPPWDADPVIGKFRNAHALTVAEARTLLHWIEQGSPRGEGPDPLESLVTPPAPDWPLGKPDIILRLPKPERIPATGVLDYRHIEVRASNASPAWVGGAWVRPGNRKVVHHVIARLIEGGRKDQTGSREMYVGWAPGTTQGWYPTNTGKFLPANARFDLEMHYVTVGSAEEDQSELGLYLLPEKPRHRYESVPVVNVNFEIPPGASAAPVNGFYGFTRGATLHSVTPHMHLRGRSMKFDLLTPSGRKSTICSVPRYDFNWQHTYELPQPVRITPGTWAMLSGTYDNSARNPANPDPTKPVYWGDQTFNEMFLGWYNVAWDPEEPAQASTR